MYVQGPMLNRLMKPTLKNSPRLELVCQRPDWGEEILYQFLSRQFSWETKVCVLLYDFYLSLNLWLLISFWFLFCACKGKGNVKTEKLHWFIDSLNKFITKSFIRSPITIIAIPFSFDMQNQWELSSIPLNFILFFFLRQFNYFVYWYLV